MPLCTDEELVNGERDVFVITPQISELKRVEILFNSRQPLDPVEITYDSRKSAVVPLVICLPGSVPY